MKTLLDVLPPDGFDIKLTDGRVAKVGALTLGMVARIERDFGNLETFNSQVLQKATNVSGIADVLWYLVKNFRDFKDKDELLDLISMQSVHDFKDQVQGLIVQSLPGKTDAAPAAGDEGNGSTTGETSSPPSAGTTDTASPSASS